MNEIATGPVSAVPLVTTHVDRTRELVEVEKPVTKVVEKVKVIDTYDFRGVISLGLMSTRLVGWYEGKVMPRKKSDQSPTND